jgi:hypothetical protein
MNKKASENKSGMEDYFDFSRLRAGRGLETMSMPDFLRTVALPGLLSLPLPGQDVGLSGKSLWEYLEKACALRQWQPGKAFLGLNVTSHAHVRQHSAQGSEHLGDFSSTPPRRIADFSLHGARKLWPYDLSLHAPRALYFPGHANNRLLTHFYSYLFFAHAHEDRRMKRFVRDRVRYPDPVFCVASAIVEQLLALQPQPQPQPQSQPQPQEQAQVAVAAEYVAFHIRRGDFQQKQTRLAAEEIAQRTAHLVPDRARRVAYIATDERNRSFFAPFARTYRAVYFLDDLGARAGLSALSRNLAGMVEQVVCAAAHTFVGTPLSTFTAYITRMRGYLNRTRPEPGPGRGQYARTFYFMPRQMHQLHAQPHMRFPLWTRDFADAFQGIDEH